MKKKIAATLAAVKEKLQQTTLEVNGKSYLLAYDFDSIVAAEEATGLELLIGVDWSRIGAKRIQAMLYASMLKDQPEITLAEVGKLLSFKNLAKIEMALVETWTNVEKQESAAS